MLNSDSKSEVEGLRWVLTRRSVMGILFMAFMVLTSLRYASYKSHEDEVKKKREAVMKTDERVEDLPAQGAAEILAANWLLALTSGQSIERHGDGRGEKFDIQKLSGCATSSGTAEGVA